MRPHPPDNGRVTLKAWPFESRFPTVAGGVGETENARLKAHLEVKEVSLAGLSARVDELARARDGKPNGVGTNSNPNLDLVARVNRLTAELDGLRDENRRLKRMHQDANRGE